MTSQKSSVNVFWFTFWNAIKNHMLIPFMTFVGITIFYPVFSYYMIKSYTEKAIQDPNFKITDYFKYILTPDYILSGGFDSIIPYIGIFLSVALGVVMFNFITKKKTVNVYYSLGITRSKLFSATYLSGIVMMFFAIALPYLIDLFINIKYFGYSSKLGQAVLFLILGTYALFLISFTVTALVMSVIGTTFEGAAYSGLFIITPLIITFCIEKLMNLFLFGSKYGIANSSFKYNAGLENISFSNDYGFLVPTNILLNGLPKFAVLAKNNSISSESNYTNIYWSAPSFSAIIGWIVLSAALFFIGKYLFKHRKAEIAGFLGINKTVNFIVTLIIGFAVFVLTASILKNTSISSVALIILISAVVFAVFYLIVDAFMTRNLKVYVKGLIKLPVHLGIILLIFLIFSTGLFGYSSRVPKVEDIKSVEMSLPAGYLTATNISSGGYDDVSLGQMNSVVKGFKSENDLKLITSLHNQIISEGKQKYNQKDIPDSSDDVVYGNIYIKYNLKNGNSLTRYYDTVKLSTLTKMLKIEETDNYKNKIKLILSEPVKKSDSNTVKDLKTLIQTPANSNILLNSNLLDQTKAVEMSGKQRKEFLNCLVADLTKQTYKERYFPSGESIGVISFMPTNNYMNKFASGPNSYESYDNYGGKTASSQSVDTSEINFKNYLTSIANTQGSSYNIILTDDMENTLAFLQGNNLMSYFEPSSKIASAEVISRKVFYSSNSWYSYDNSWSYQFFGGIITKEAYDSNNNEGSDESNSFKNAYNVTDIEALNELESISYLSFYTGYEGYFVRYTLDSGDRLIMFIPEYLIPQQIKDGVAKNKTPKSLEMN